MLTAAASSHALKTAPQRSPSGRLRNSETPWPWRTERPPNQSQEQVPWRPERPFWNPTRNLLLSCYRARILSYPAILLFRNTAETAKHHLISCRKWRKINRKNKFPGGRNVPSEILLEILSNPAIHKATAAAGLQNVPLATPKHHATEGRNDFQKKRCPGAWRPLWILLKTKQLLLQASKTYPRHTETPCHWRTERLSKTRCPGAWRPFWILLKTKQLLLQASKTYPSPHRNTMALKDGTTSKSIARTSSLEAGTSLLKCYWKSSPL